MSAYMYNEMVKKYLDYRKLNDEIKAHINKLYENYEVLSPEQRLNLSKSILEMLQFRNDVIL